MNITPIGANFIGQLLPGDPELETSLIHIPDDARTDYVRVSVLSTGPGWTGAKTGKLSPTGLKRGDVALMLFGHWIVGADISEHYDGNDRPKRQVRMLKASGVSMVVG